MTPLSIALFDSAADLEAAEYRVRSGLRATQAAFRDLNVEPHFADAVGLHRALSALVEGATAVDEAGPVVGVDWEAGRLLRERGRAPLALELARWALPLLEAVIAEGRAVYEFVSDHTELATVGVVPAYRDEGFLLVGGGPALRALRYHVSPLSGPSGRYRALRTTALEVALDPLAAPAAWKSALADAVPELPMPAAFRLASDVDLPVDGTLVPVAKRKLLGLVGTWGQA